MSRLQTTTIGSMPKPDYLNIPNWGNCGSDKYDFRSYAKVQENCSQDQFEENIMKATQDALRIQTDTGITIATDGEMRRDNYIYDFVRKLDGFDFVNAVEVVYRNGAATGILPQIVGPVTAKRGKPHLQVAEEWLKIHQLAPPDMSLKFTLPGPMTIYDTMKNSYYKDRRTFTKDVAPFINEAVLSLVDAGCKYIQIDEPLFARLPDEALSFGFEMLEECFKGVPSDVTRAVHICCGYPDYLDQQDYQKADPDAYLRLADAIDNCSFIDQVSIEDAHRRNDKKLFQKFRKTTVILGVIDVVRSRIETVEEIVQHIKEVLEVIPKDRLVIAPDCGLTYLTRDLMIQKLANMRKAVETLASEL